MTPAGQLVMHEIMAYHWFLARLAANRELPPDTLRLRRMAEWIATHERRVTLVSLKEAWEATK